jgi:hypothetical protein
LIFANYLFLFFLWVVFICLLICLLLLMDGCHERDSNSDGVDFSQLGGGVDFSLNVTDVTVTVTVRTFPDLEAVPTFQL